MNEPNAIMDPLIRQLMESAATGEAAKMFLNSELGKHITQRAVGEIDEAIDGLVEADPFDGKAVAEMQTRIKVAKQAVMWLTDAIAEGDNALRQLHED